MLQQIEREYQQLYIPYDQTKKEILQYEKELEE
jgi:hypothetical protein